MVLVGVMVGVFVIVGVKDGVTVQVGVQVGGKVGRAKAAALCGLKVGNGVEVDVCDGVAVGKKTMVGIGVYVCVGGNKLTVIVSVGDDDEAPPQAERTATPNSMAVIIVNRKLNTFP